MANIIAIVWDFDKTLVDGYMQDPIFEEYGVDPKQFWQEVNGLPEKYQKEQNVKVNKDTIYLNHFIHYEESQSTRRIHSERSLLKRTILLGAYLGIKMVQNDPRRFGCSGDAPRAGSAGFDPSFFAELGEIHEKTQKNCEKTLDKPSGIWYSDTKLNRRTLS